MNYWKIDEKAAKNGMSVLRIIIEGEEVKTITSGSIRHLSSIADNVYKLAFNENTLSGWKYNL